MLSRYFVSFDHIRKIAVASLVFTTVVLLFSCAAQSRDKLALTQEIAQAFTADALTVANGAATDHRRGKYLSMTVSFFKLC